MILPRHLEIIYEINRRFLESLRVVILTIRPASRV
jgi:hypothetical protein